jgi:hypothetical protein
MKFEGESDNSSFSRAYLDCPVLKTGLVLADMPGTS